MIWRTTILAIAAAVFLIAGVPAWAEPNNASSIKTLDTDSDGTGRLSAKELAVADPDHDGTLSKNEYLAVVEQRFNAADLDHDGTLDEKELHFSAGVSLVRLVK